MLLFLETLIVVHLVKISCLLWNEEINYKDSVTLSFLSHITFLTLVAYFTTAIIVSSTTIE